MLRMSPRSPVDPGQIGDRRGAQTDFVYKHILIPTDGSELAERAVAAGIAFAKSVNARVTAFTALEEYRVPGEAELIARHGKSLAQHAAEAKQKAEAILGPVRERAAAAGVACDTCHALSDRPYEAIVQAADKQGCDLIFMASHGRRGIRALVYGSQAQGVLTHSKIPTLVYR
jgi:nucleotide-binding universal stress UspA family protein